jgi:enoyl-CoA hydratase/carnithine racemase
VSDRIVSVGAPHDHVAVVELTYPPNNFFSFEMISGVADALEHLDADDSCRCVLLCAAGKHFCAGADFSRPSGYSSEQLYAAAVRLFRTRKPIVAVVQGAAIGGGLGLALAADFRVASPDARFSANFARLGFHHGFGLSVTLPALVGRQAAARLLFTGERIDGTKAVDIGLADELASPDHLRARGFELAASIAASAPLAVESIRATLRGDLADRVQAATVHEAAEQARLQRTADFAEGVAASAARRDPQFVRR